jgi:GNAT superfamily N-acetyltransferase
VLMHAPALIAAYMRACADGRCGPFSLRLDSHSDDPMRNYAVPDQDARPGAGDIEELVTFFRRRGRIPRLEYIEDSAPRVWSALAAAGFTVERRTPVMIATSGTPLTPRSPAGIIIRAAVDEADLAAAAAVQHHAYGRPAPGPHDIARLARLAQGGGIVAIALDEASGTVMGTGLVDVTGESRTVGELAAVGVLAGFRRRGTASALSAWLARTACSRGIGVVFLEAEPDEEQIYRRTGFTDVTTKIWTSIR